MTRTGVVRFHTDRTLGTPARLRLAHIFAFILYAQLTNKPPALKEGKNIDRPLRQKRRIFTHHGLRVFISKQLFELPQFLRIQALYNKLFHNRFRTYKSTG